MDFRILFHSSGCTFGRHLSGLEGRWNIWQVFMDEFPIAPVSVSCLYHVETNEDMHQRRWISDLGQETQGMPILSESKWPVINTHILNVEFRHCPQAWNPTKNESSPGNDCAPIQTQGYHPTSWSQRVGGLVRTLSLMKRRVFQGPTASSIDYRWFEAIWGLKKRVKSWIWPSKVDNKWN